jgi:hypothetical protein
VGDVYYVVVIFFLVHGGHDLVELGANGGVIPFLPVQECVVTRCRRIEVIRAPDGHDACVVRDQCLGNAVGVKRFDDRWDVAIGAGVVVAEEPDGGSHAQVIVEEAREERVSLVAVQCLLLVPVEVVPGEPEKVVSMEVYASAKQVREEWMALVQGQDVRGFEEPGLEDEHV